MKRPRRWEPGPLENGPEGGHYRDVFITGTSAVVATVPLDFPEDLKHLNQILEAPEAVRACVMLKRAMDDYGHSVFHDLFENNRHWDIAEKLALTVARSYGKGRAR